MKYIHFREFIVSFYLYFPETALSHTENARVPGDRPQSQPGKRHGSYFSKKFSLET